MNSDELIGQQAGYEQTGTSVEQRRGKVDRVSLLYSNASNCTVHRDKQSQPRYH